MTAATLRGIFLTSEQPEACARFYIDVAGLPLEHVGTEGVYVYWKIDRDGLQLAIHDAKTFSAYTHPAVRASNLTHLYFKIDDQAAFLNHLEGLAVAPALIDDVVVTVADPDGRMVMFGTA
ncbi:VOC family protein [Hyphomicrobium sp. xq]|uniref:VOC family protein n=1 Tax=Hyphomicrobium album TaxID=2665159 RepID=A0A6I3KDX4_9HYPH|nr:VOC family protein [Hyphomicrobium album]MTD93064.1 VOC family protein [Hyphomicrobium album]